MFQDLGTTQEVQKYIDDGWQIHYSPLSGGVGLWNPDGRWTNVSIKPLSRATSNWLHFSFFNNASRSR